MTATRADVVVAARAWLRTPYLHEGNVQGLRGGVDCAMILVRVYCDLGLIPQIDPRPYPRQWFMHRDEERYLKWFTDYAHRVEAPQPGDVLLFRYGRTVSHSGIVVAPDLMVHAYAPVGCVDLAETRGFMHRFDSAWSVFP